MAPGNTLIRRLLLYSLGENATDLHLCPGVEPLVRINGQLTKLGNEDIINAADISEIQKALLDEDQRELLDKKKVLDFSFSMPGLGRFRANIYSQRGTFAIAIRMLSFDIPLFETLGLPETVRDFTKKTKGLVLVTGATGSGKSTTLATLLDLINKTCSCHILTIEDPIEYLHNHQMSLVTQREIGADTKSFAQALRSALREDPDVIMVGEMRDPETIAVALTAAETGHLVFSTLHTIGAAKSIDRIVDAFSQNQQNQIRSQLATVLEGVVSQQLLPKADQSGMVLATEILHINPAVRNLIREGKNYQITSIMQTGQSQGMHLLEADLARLCSEGAVTKEDAMIRAQDPQLLAQLINRR